MPEDEPIPLQMREAGAPRLGLKLSHGYRMVEDAEPGGPWRVRTASYHYNIYRADERGTFQEFLLYHWHPTPQPPTEPLGAGRPVTTPHVHVKAARVEPGDPAHLARHVSDLHLPTGLVALEDIVRFAITELGVRWLRNDWEDVLQRTRAVFLQSRTWAG